MELEEESVDFRVLLGKGSKGGSSNIPKRGSKDFAPDGSDIHEENLKEARKALQEVISEERIPNTLVFSKITTLSSVTDSALCNTSQLSQGIWLPLENRVEITVKKGTQFNTMGYNEKAKIFLHPEEALFLLERGALIILHHNVPMSLQQGYATLLSQSCPFEKYQVYAYLKRLGYIALKPSRSEEETSSASGTYSHMYARNVGHNNMPAEMSNEGTARFAAFGQYASAIYEAILKLLPNFSEVPITLTNQTYGRKHIFKNLRSKSPEYLSSSFASNQWDSLTGVEKVSIDYDVYKPLPTFRKKDPGSASFHIIVQRFEDEIPNPLAMRRMISFEEPSGEVLFAIASQGNISFVNMNTCETTVL
ncbi:hypothetical protein K493DRAFT_303562 [Basidiobolus meristosporus CBS 931.73]|uniref:tRNA-splicing endonuclease subunit Sen54 N-terminal domain-containing protein n=1 Tax=Basidiobolus meristosporus CBS 931.73 TaxID=1314790 RepID=A0A1Y1Y3D6_9FUNG|nr:hypothetical protein K493DRAFT_303562 [Basidiobolus meristosporus CBS 931.73]|eukprot:ORX92104.1 hypothetical protein K493DRAFT_303562 [Basidiobolus meristosporus CBS 931.73]